MKKSKKKVELLDELKNFNIGDIIKRFRKAYKWSRKELAKAAGISPAAIYKIETNQMIPTVVTLIKIAKALKKNIQEILSIDLQDSYAVIKKNQRLKFNSPEFPVTLNRISGDLNGRKIEAGIIRLKKGAGVSKKPMRHEGEELHFVLKGKILYYINNEEFLLKKGDSIHFYSSNPHNMKNTEEGEAEVLVVVTPSPFV